MRISFLVFFVPLLVGCFATGRSGSSLKLEDVVDDKKCITDRVGYSKLKFGASGQAAFSEAVLGGDIDGDGTIDSVVKLVGAPTTVFASNKGCLRDLGDVRGTIAALVEPEGESGGIRDVLTFSASGCNGFAGRLSLWTLNGRDPIPPRTVAICGCPDLARPDPTRHDMCPAVRPN